MIGNGSSLGAVKFGSDTALYFRQKILGPFLAQYLIERRAQGKHRPRDRVRDRNERVAPLFCLPPQAEGDKATPLYLRAGLKLSQEAPQPGDAAFEEYISDPAKPVPFVRRPIQAMGYEEGNPWPRWLADDQPRPPGARTS